MFSATTPRKALLNRTWALFAFFFLPGIVMASWATRTPAIRHTLSVSTAGMGTVLLGLSIGSISGILCSSWLVKRFGTHNIIRSGMTLMVIGMMLMSLALYFSSPIIFATGLTFLGMGMGSAEVAMNVEGAIVEGLMKKTLLPMMHGFFSLGTLVGAGVGLALTAVNFIAFGHLLLIALLIVIPIAIAIRAIPQGTGKSHSNASEPSSQPQTPFYKDIQLLLIGTIVLAMAFAEGSANDWLPLLMVDGHGFSPTSGSLIYVGFTLGMTVGRFTGGTATAASLWCAFAP